MGLPKMGYPLRLLLAAAASPTSLKTTNACPLILSFLLQMICWTCPKAWNKLKSAYLRSA